MPRDRRDGPIRVAHIVHSFRTGGCEHGIVKLLNALPAGRYRHSLISLTELGPLARKIRAPGTRFHEVRKRDGNDLGAVWRLAALLRAERPHVLRTYGWPTWLEGIAAATAARVRAHVHSEHGLYFYQSEAQKARRRKAEPALAAVTDAVVAVSGDIALALRRAGVAPRKVQVIRNGVDTEVFAPPPAAARAEAREALGIPEGALAVGSVGRLVPEKDYPSLVRAAHRLAAGGRAVAVAIAGEGPERARIEAAAAEGEARLLLLGPRDDVPAVLRALDVFALPSLSEGLSNTLLEATATGLPCVASRVGGNPEVIRDGANGLLVPSGDVDALAG
ncbi:MAG TPA: glycosyltransferase, partial [Planctomycetota bacterium]|nr:glycosyltransferase [Planctomycetota bacterium]